jgi:hypothetical protein
MPRDEDFDPRPFSSTGAEFRGARDVTFTPPTALPRTPPLLKSLVSLIYVRA